MANSLPFNAIEHDRVYKAEDWAWYFSTFIGNGVFPKPSDGLQVIAYQNMEIKVNAGYAFINGYAFKNPTNYNITLDTAEGALNRIDRIVVRWDLPQRDIYIAVLKGTPSARPIAPAITRNTEYWELAIADVYVGKGVTSIRTANITDLRFNSAVCGIVHGTVEQIDASVLTRQFTDFFNIYSQAIQDEYSIYKQDMEQYLADIRGVYNQYVTRTEALFTQYESQFNDRYSNFNNTLATWETQVQAAYNTFLANITVFERTAEQDFNTWFEGIKGQLSGDIAGQLQLAIDQLTGRVDDLGQQVEEGSQATAEEIEALDARVTAIESGWGINLKHEAVLGLCFMGAAYMTQQKDRTVEAAVLGLAHIGNAYMANTF